MTITPAITNVNESGSAVITCEANAGVQPEAVVIWETENLQSNFSLIQGKDKTRAELHIHNASAFDNGWVKCVARSIAGKITNSTRYNVSCKAFTINIKTK